MGAHKIDCPTTNTSSVHAIAGGVCEKLFSHTYTIREGILGTFSKVVAREHDDFEFS